MSVAKRLLFFATDVMQFCNWLCKKNNGGAKHWGRQIDVVAEGCAATG
jgi:hypothetical protein